MNNWYVSFNVENNQKDYVNCLRVIEQIQDMESREQADAEFLKKTKIRHTMARLRPEDAVKDAAEGKGVSDKGILSDIKRQDDVHYIFSVSCAEENDITNLIYYCLLNERVKRKSILCIRCGQKQGANIRDLLSELVREKIIKAGYTCIDGVYTNISAKARVMRRFTPIFRIDEKEESAAYWRRSMYSFLLDLYRAMPIDTAGAEYTTNYFLPHICPTVLKDRYPKDVWRVHNRTREICILNNMVGCFCTGEKDHGNIPVEFCEKRYKWWKSQELFDKIKDMSLLAMYIFCISDYFQRDVENDSWEKIEQEIFDARDMADGVLQILENVYHSEGRCGYFCLRVHNSSESRSGRYLNKEYGSYMDKFRGDEKAPLNYLEIRIVDYSHLTIPKRFYSDFLKRKEAAAGPEKSVYESLEAQAAQIKVSSFYDAPDFWNLYNSISENVVHHYGLLIFEALVSCYDGYFRVRSQETTKLCSQEEFYSTLPEKPQEEAIPGTHYDIIIPFRTQSRLQNLSVDVNIDYTGELLKDYSVCEGIGFTTQDCMELYEEVRKRNLSKDVSYQERKEQVIKILAEQLWEVMGKKPLEGRIVHFTAKKIALTMIELFCKAVMLCIAKKDRSQSCYIMITDCTQSHFVEITRMMALFYNKQGINSLMYNTQIFMGGQNEGEEFLITGTSLGEAIGSTEKLAFARCIHPYCLKTLKNMLKNHSMGMTPNDMVSIAPFDMIEYSSGEKTLLERNLRKVLEQDVQSEKFGCKLDKLHVRIGSKIHINTFYEAELLFHNNYYTSRFAYWLFNEMWQNKELDKEQPFVLVGYENYSEMLLNELCDMLARKGTIVEYLIYEERIEGKFRGKKPLNSYRDYQFVIIVPINSTLTTHIKISGFLEKNIRELLRRKEEVSCPIYRLKKVLNYGVVLITPQGQNQYWEATSQEHTVQSKIKNERMKYYIEVTSKWSHPLTCRDCFPVQDYTRETPLVETNKESVVPMHAINIRRPKPKAGECGETKEEMQRLEELSECLTYRHVERNGNHFNYYFSLEKIWDIPQIRENIKKWMRNNKQKLFRPEACKVYDVIVAPLHYSNTVFVEEVNRNLFSNAALVLHFDADKEFRINVRTKYSTIQQLYDNLCEDNNKSVINFHYIDDTIVSGRSFRRMKSLICSMIQQRDKSTVQVNIFKSIVLMLNRMSQGSIKDYIQDTRYFLAYFHLNISSMRVNSDACVLCKKYNEWNKLAKQASLNEVYGYWKNRSNDLKCIPVEKIIVKEETGKHLRAKQYMIASHRASKLLNQICDYSDTDYIKKRIVEVLFPDEIGQTLDELAAMLKILGRPFLTFRKEEKEAAFELMLIMLDTLLQTQEPDGSQKLDRLLRQVYNDVDKRVLLVELLMNRLAELESNYMIRKRSMYEILGFCEKNIADEDKKKQFVDNYVNRVKQLVGQSNDFAKGLYLEYLLLYDEEYQESFVNKDIKQLSGDGTEAGFKKRVYLENTKLVDYGIEYLATFFANGMELNGTNLKNVLNENYFFDNFIQYLTFHKMVEMDNKDKVEKFVSEEKRKQIQGMVQFELLYRKIFRDNTLLDGGGRKTSVVEEDLKDKFKDMLECLRDASGALDGEIIVPYGDLSQGEKYISLELSRNAELKILKSKEQNLRDFMRQNSSFVGDTYAVCEWKQEPHKWVLLKFYDAAGERKDTISVIFLLFTFEIQEEGELLHSIKNLLIFRHKIWEILNLSSSTLLRNWTDNLFYKQQMLKSRAVGHSELDTLYDSFDDLVKEMDREEYQSKSTQDKLIYEKYFKLLVDSMIGSMNAKVLANRGTEYIMNVPLYLSEFWNGEKDVINAVSRVWKLDILIRNEEIFGQYKFRCGTDMRGMAPGGEVLRIIFLAAFHNIYRHGRRNMKQLCEVSIYVEDECLFISNDIDENKEEIAREAYREGVGISQAVIFDVCQGWFRNLKYEEMFQICRIQGNDENSNGNKGVYMVKLPIIERWEQNE